MGRRNKKKRSNNGTNNGPARHLPQEIMLYDILPRVPYKSLNRFRCVCKQWSNLFGDPLFMSFYSRYRSNRSNRQGFIYLKGDSVKGEYFVNKDEAKLTPYSFSFHDIDKKQRIRIPFRLPKGDLGDYKSYVPKRRDYHGAPIIRTLVTTKKNTASVSILDCLNGLLLLCFSFGNEGERSRVYVYSPVSGRSVFVAPDVDDFVDYRFLVYDPIISKYKVVGLDMKSFLCFLTVGGDSDSPRRCHSKLHKYAHRICKPVFVNHALHWICGKDKGATINLEDVYGEILRLDVSEEKVSTIKLPVMCSNATGRLLEMGGLLSFICRGSNNRFELKLWYLKNNCDGYKDGEWIVKCSLNLATDISLRQLIRSGTYSWNDEPVVIVMDPKCKLIFSFASHTPVIFTSTKFVRRYIYSYDIDLKHWDLIHEGTGYQRRYEMSEQRFHYWH